MDPGPTERAQDPARGASPAFEIRTEEVRCPVCDASDARSYRRDMYRLGDVRFSLVRCGCGMVYLNPRPDAPTIARMYDDPAYYAEGYSLGVEDDNYFERRGDMLGVYDEVVGDIQRRTGVSGRLVELGSAGGFFLEAARRRGFEVTGVELSSTAVEYSRSELGLEVHQGELEDAPLEEQSFDLAVADNVLEHSIDPHGVLTCFWRLLKPGGVLYVVVPSYVNSVWFRALMHLHRLLPRRFLGKRMLRILKFDPDSDGGYPYHILEFDRRTVVRLVRDAGFAPILVQNSVPLPAHLFAEGARGLRNSILRTVFRTLDGLMRAGLVPGARVSLLARRPR